MGFVVQALLELDSTFGLRVQLLRAVHSHLIEICANFYGSAVVSKAMQLSDIEDCRCLARAILNVSGLLAAVGASSMARLLWRRLRLWKQKEQRLCGNSLCHL